MNGGLFKCKFFLCKNDFRDMVKFVSCALHNSAWKFHVGVKSLGDDLKQKWPKRAISL